MRATITTVYRTQYRVDDERQKSWLDQAKDKKEFELNDLSQAETEIGAQPAKSGTASASAKHPLTKFTSQELRQQQLHEQEQEQEHVDDRGGRSAKDCLVMTTLVVYGLIILMLLYEFLWRS